MERCEPTEDFLQGCAKGGIALSAEEMEQLGVYLWMLLDRNKRFNLTGIREEGEAWMRHVLDSLSVARFVEGGEKMVDVGSGGGLPGVVVGIVRRDVEVVLLEATGKKARFLEEVVAELGLEHVKMVCGRAEEVGQEGKWRGKFDVAVARAVGPMRVLLELMVPLVKVGGRVLAMKGRNVEEEMEEAGDAMMKLGCGEVELWEALPGLEDEAVVVEVRKARVTPRGYPRRAGVPKHEPL